MSGPRLFSRGSRATAAVAVALLLGGALAGCNGSASDTAGEGGSTADDEAPEVPEVSVSTNLGKAGSGVPVSKVVKIKASDGTLTRVVAKDSQGNKLAGGLNAAGTAWTAKDRLEPGESYTLRTVAKSADGTAKRSKRTFSTVDLTLDEQTYASIAPLDGETVGIGMPVVVQFDIPVQNKAKFERHLEVTSTPQQKGSWHWVNDTIVRYRPAKYWKPGTEVSVEVDINSLPAGNGIYGQESRSIDFNVGESVVSKVDMNAHTMKTFINGKLARTMPVTTGKDGFTTRRGIKVIMGKHRTKNMNSSSIGIDPDAAEGYDIENVEYAMRLTHSGEFIHAAPWSVGSQGSANVSHGCTGLSTADAGWLYENSKRGDVVTFTGSDRPMTLENGYGGWNVPFAEYAKGSAL